MLLVLSLDLLTVYAFAAQGGQGFYVFPRAIYRTGMAIISYDLRIPSVFIFLYSPY